LYDCYVANQRLSEEDWLEFGKEEHHVVTPARDGGRLDPLNAQWLTTYQHWVAGVLQSEVLGYKCFAMVPKGVLPPDLESIRVKHEQLKLTREHQVKAGLAVSVEQQSKNGKRGGKAGAGKPKAKWTPERRTKTIATLKATLATKWGSRDG
jgi:hypothetical protein